MKKIPITELTRDYKIEVEESDGVVAYYLVDNSGKRYLMESKSDDEAVAEIKTIDKRLGELRK